MESLYEALDNLQLDFSTTSDRAPFLHKADANRNVSQFDKAVAMKAFDRTIKASERLQRIMGQRDPEPFATPPALPEDLEKKFTQALQESELDDRNETKCSDTSSEKVSKPSKKRRRSGRKKNKSGSKDVDVTDEQAVEIAFASTAPIKNNPPLATVPLVPAPSWLPAAITCHTKIDYDNKHLSFETLHEHCKQGLAALPDNQYPMPYATDAGTRMHSGLGGIAELNARIGLPTLLYNKKVSDVPSANQMRFPKKSNGQSQPTSIPQITVQSAPPTRVSELESRAPPSFAQMAFGPRLGLSHPGETTGLPVVPAEFQGLWKSRFPGNTPALLKNLFDWSCAMRSMYLQSPTVKAFTFNTAFPWRIKPPSHDDLISVGFYDTAAQPHKEIRFFGPGDAADIVYGEVDVFRSQGYPARGSEANSTKKTPGSGGTGPSPHGQYMPSHHLAEIGEGRWAYILIKGHHNTKDVAPPYVMIAFHTSAITKSSPSLQTIVPDSSPSSFLSTGSSQPTTAHAKSLQVLPAASHNQACLYQALRSASSSKLAHPDLGNSSTKEKAHKMLRTVLSFEKAGNYPLVEGYRVDLQAFRAWLNAVSRGNGKLVIWEKRK